MTKQDRVLQYEKREIVFRTGGSWVLKTLGMIVFIIGLWVFRAVQIGGSGYEGSPAIGYLIGVLFALAGVCIFFYKSEKRFNLVSRRWHVLKTVLCLRNHLEGSFDDLSTVEADCNSSTDSGLPPYTYEVKVTVKDGHYLRIRQGLLFARQALCIANELCEQLSLPLSNKTGQSNIIEMTPPHDAPKPPRRLSTSTSNGDTMTFSIPAATKLDKKYRKSQFIGWTALSAPLLAISAFGTAAFWDWFWVWYRSGDLTKLKNALISLPFVILPLLAVYTIITKAFLGQQMLKVSPSGVIHRNIYGSKLLDTHFPKDKITTIILRVNRHTTPPRVEDIVIFAGMDTILVGQGLPDEEKIWIASQLCRILALQQSNDR